MAGHSRWAQIKRTKAVVDAKRGAVFTRLGREIMVAARTGADPAGNFQLRTAIEKSANIATVKLLNEIGYDAVIDVLKAPQSPMPIYPLSETQLRELAVYLLQPGEAKGKP